MLPICGSGRWTKPAALRRQLLCLLLLLPLLLLMAMVEGRTSLPSSTPAKIITVATFNISIATPHNASSGLDGTQILFHPSFAGAALPQASRPDGLLQINLMLPHKNDDRTGCSGQWNTTNEFGQTFENAFILLMAGSCSSINTLDVAAKSGAMGVLVYGCPAEKPYNCETRIIMAFSLIPSSSPLPPIISIGSADGAVLVQFLKDALNSAGSSPPQDALQMLIKAPGFIVPEEHTALIAIANSTNMGPFAGGATVALPSWSVGRLQDATIDPCANRTVVGIWCEAGHVVMIDVYTTTWKSNGVPKEFGAFTQLRYFSLQQSFFYGALSTEWCNLTQLQIFRITQSGGGITAFPDCIGAAWTQLKKIQFDGNSLTNLPSSFSQLVNLQIIYGANNRIQTVPSLANLTKLSIVDFGTNAIIELPAFSPGSPNLIQIGFSSNQISVPIPPAAFDGMSALQILDLNTNHITGPLPNLIGCINLQIIDLSSSRNLTTNVGGFNSSMPISWSSLIRVQELYLQENALTSPVYASTMLSLQKVDLSHNFLTNAIPGNALNNDPAALLDTVFTPSMISMRLSYNLLTGSFVRTSIVLTSTTLHELYLDHNQLNNFIGPFFLSATPFTALDMSYNNLSSSAAFLIGQPNIRFVYLNLRGNPQLNVAQLPNWMTVGTTLTQEPGLSYGCASFAATTIAPFLNLQLDPTFWAYQNCQCNQGTFGRAPLCHSIPNAAKLNPNHVITSSEVGDGFSDLVASVGSVGSQLTIPITGNYSRSFSDGMYGENRLTLGMSTVWEVDVTTEYEDDPELYIKAGYQPPVPLQSYSINTTDDSPSSLWTPVRMITIRLHISATEFTAFEDVISVYEGASDLKGNRISTMRGTDTKSTVISTVYTNSPEYLLANNASIAQLSDPRLYEIQVFSPMVSVQFTSRAISGLHFYATYSYDFTCPDGYFYNRDASPSQCHVNYAQYHVGLPIRSAVFAVAAVAGVFILINIVILFLHWNSPIYKAASRMFMAVILIMLLCMALGSLLYASIPNVNNTGSAICIGRAWLTCLPLTGILGILLAKTNRLNAIFGATTLQVKKMTDMDIGKTVLLVCALQIVLLGVYSGLPLSRAQLAIGHGNLNDRLVLSCSQESGFMAWMGVEIAYIACMMLPAAYLGYKTRDLPSQFNESSHIQNAIVLLIFFGIIIIPLDIFIQDDPEAAVLIQGLGQAFMCMMLSVIIFGPKLYYLTQTSKRPVQAATHISPDTAVDSSEVYLQQQPHGGSGRAVGVVAGSGGKKNTPPSSAKPPGSRPPSKTANTTPPTQTRKSSTMVTTGVGGSSAIPASGSLRKPVPLPIAVNPDKIDRASVSHKPSPTPGDRSLNLRPSPSPSIDEDHRVNGGGEDGGLEAGLGVVMQAVDGDSNPISPSAANMIELTATTTAVASPTPTGTTAVDTNSSSSVALSQSVTTPESIHLIVTSPAAAVV